MHRSYHHWHSPALDRTMELLVFGHAGARVLAFPASLHPFYDGEDRIAAGPSFGAYHALNFALHRPDLVQRVLGMGGLYDIRRFTDGYYDDNVYFNNPIDCLANEHDAGRLAELRKREIILAVGQADPLPGINQQLSGVLWGKGIWHALRIQDGFAHDWPIWARMLPLYVGGHD
jgi:esterase/lipase superfamily enzyme